MRVNTTEKHAGFIIDGTPFLSLIKEKMVCSFKKNSSKFFKLQHNTDCTYKEMAGWRNELK